MFPLPRILYSMSTDGILFRFLGNVNSRTHTPVISTLLSGALAGVMALLFDLTQLIEMLSIGTLLAYSIVALCVLVLRSVVQPWCSRRQAFRVGGSAFLLHGSVRFFRRRYTAHVEVAKDKTTDLDSDPFRFSVSHVSKYIGTGERRFESKTRPRPTLAKYYMSKSEPRRHLAGSGGTGQLGAVVYAHGHVDGRGGHPRGRLQ